MKCEGLDDKQAAEASVPPSDFTLTGLVQHMAEVERNWFRRVFAGEQAPPIYDPKADPDAPDGGFDVAEGATLSTHELRRPASGADDLVNLRRMILAEQWKPSSDGDEQALAPLEASTCLPAHHRRHGPDHHQMRLGHPLKCTGYR